MHPTEPLDTDLGIDPVTLDPDVQAEGLLLEAGGIIMIGEAYLGLIQGQGGLSMVLPLATTGIGIIPGLTGDPDLGTVVGLPQMTVLRFLPLQLQILPLV